MLFVRLARLLRMGFASWLSADRLACPGVQQVVPETHRAGSAPAMRRLQKTASQLPPQGQNLCRRSPGRTTRLLYNHNNALSGLNARRGTNAPDPRTGHLFDLVDSLSGLGLSPSTAPDS
jgi:hypothetical protein